MNSLKKVILITLVVIPLILIIFNMFFDPFCYILIIDTANKNIIKELMSEEEYSIDDTKVIIIDNKPNKYDKVLTRIYGEDFMRLPPMEKRITHKPVRIWFGD